MNVPASAWPGFAATAAVAERLGGLETLEAVLSVYDAAQVDSIRKLPAAVVVSLAERAVSGQSDPGHALLPQTVEMRIGVILVFGSPNDPSGRKTCADNTPAEVLGQIREKLLGWLPPPPTENHGVTGPLAFAAGRLIEIGDGRIFWQDEWSCRYRISRECS